MIKLYQLSNSKYELAQIIVRNKVRYLKESKRRRELELLHKLCKEHNISTTLAQELITSSKKFSYENVNQSTRIKEYQELINYHTKLK